ncbi:MULTISPECIES: Fe-S cluster assembly sulfur transfer protein SufU [unclassified Pseudactinotalea]|uniref:Fe-S cluster assembly sulfur transfer protein SufU n=1 Tax=unclassified Pseudactinotalea TaxID=2649176 RepID=UPI00128E82BB|nr:MULTISPECIES: SUF system NifU family Fe-S cluster assembly protein [unclassified Pseudactinotalea]MPV49836.1 SUF system NifU family Fe-S cluster assembly protein [Pseudactinotalea sp. HY160]QGH69101.1 SUF system NifU family Fe-S cluster assembly protein [Pseudactinotalea sp. HY158]
MTTMDQLYQQVILDHSRERHGEGLEPASSGESFQVNPTCGDEVRLQVHLTAAGDRIDRVTWEGQGCAISQASTSVLVDLVDGAELATADRLGELFRDMMHTRSGPPAATVEHLGDGAAFAGVAKYPARVKCAMLGWVALRDATARALAAADPSSTPENSTDTGEPHE